jgi:hypothetical protein
LERIKIVGQGIDQLPRGKLLKQSHSEQFADESPRFAHAHVARICLPFLPKLQAVGDQAVERAAVEVVGEDLLLDGLDEELRDLRRAELVP